MFGKSKEIRFTKPFSDKYTLLIETNLVAINMSMQSKAKMRWAFDVHKVMPEYIEVSLLTLENVVLESNNPMLNDIANMSQAFAKMYSELHLILNHQGKVLEVLNMDLILSKWAHTKKEMEAAVANTPEAKDIITINDEIFNNKEKIKLAIGSSEFFLVYFPYIYGKNIPYTDKKSVHNNFLNTAILNWKSKAKVYDSELINSDVTKINVEAVPNNRLSRSWHKTAYKSYAKLLDVGKLDAKLSKNADYIVENNTSKIIKAVLRHQEIVDEKSLYNKMTYSFFSETWENPVSYNSVQ